MKITGNGDGTFTFSRADGSQTLMTMDASGLVAMPAGSKNLTLAAAQNTTSGTAIDFTGVPSWVKRITVIFQSLSTNGSSLNQIQLGTSGGFVTTGYQSGASSPGGTNVVVGANSTTGLLIDASNGAGVSKQGHAIITLISGNIWVMSGSNGRNDGNYTNVYGGMISLGGTLDRIRLTTVNGTDAFDAGSANIMYEG
jgi:hypothetical protein